MAEGFPVQSSTKRSEEAKMAIEEKQGVDRETDPAEAADAQVEQAQPAVEPDDVEAHVWRAQS
jgi:hypothetical protein